MPPIRPAPAAKDAVSSELPQPVSNAWLAAVCLALFAASFAVYGKTMGYGFIAYDDNRYVYENPVVRAGLNGANLLWALKTFYFANWSPLTWISYMAEIQLFGVNAGEMHAVNAALHGLATVLLFLALVRMTRQPWRCALVAAGFALHPLHVQSVAWIADRKDVLSGLFVALTVFLYAGYAKAPSRLRYISVAAAFALSLMAKTMAVTVPLVLLLLDFWPLRRLSRRAVLEKVPLIGMAGIAGALTFLAQRSAAELVAAGAFNHLTLPVRVANAAVNYVRYIVMAFWPANLAVVYPPHTASLVSALGAAAILLVLTGAAIKWIRHLPFLLMGWLWFLVMLVPVIGIVQQIGDQDMADRYMYLPVTGLLIAAIWAISDAIAKQPVMLRAAAAVSIAWLTVLGFAAVREASYWTDSRTLFKRGLAVTDGNYLLANNLGVVLLSKDPRSVEAAALFRQAIAFNPNHAPAHVNLGLEVVRSGQLEEGRAHLAEALRLNPKLAEAQAGMGVLMAGEGNYEEARRRLEESLRLDANQAEAQNNLCAVLLHLGRLEEAATHCEQALRVRPAYAMARVNLARTLAMRGLRAEAEQELQLALGEEPGNTVARQALVDLRSGQLR